MVSILVMGYSIPFTDLSLYKSLTKVNRVFESLESTESVTQSVLYLHTYICKTNMILY